MRYHFVFCILFVISPLLFSSEGQDKVSPKTLCEFLRHLDQGVNMEVEIEGQMLIDGSSAVLWSSKCRSANLQSNDLPIAFSTDYRIYSDPHAVRILEKLRSKSRPGSPRSGLTIVQLNTQRAWVVLQGKLRLNPNFDRNSGGKNLLSRPCPADQYILEVIRVISAREMDKAEEW